MINTNKNPYTSEKTWNYTYTGYNYSVKNYNVTTGPH